MKFQKILPSLICVSTLSLHGAPVLPGTKFGIDYGPTLTANWNNFTAVGSKAAGTVVLLSGLVSESLAMTVSNGQFFNNDGTNNWVGLQSNPTSIAPNPKAPPEFVESVTTDIAGNFNLGDANPFRLVITGLNPYLSFKTDSLSSAASGTGTEAMTVLGAETYGPVAIPRPLTVSQGLFHQFASVVPTLGGQLTFESIQSGAATNPIVNAVLIEALEPTAAGLLDNDADSMPNWWEVAYGFDPESAADGGMTDSDGDGFTNVAEFAGGSDPRDPLSVPVVPSWVVDGDGVWGAVANWSSGSVPNGEDRLASLPSAALLTAPGATIDLNVPVTLALLETAGGKPFTLTAGNPLTFRTSTPQAQVRTGADAGSGLEFLGPLVVASPLRVTTGGTSIIRLSGTLTESGDAHPITKSGGGDLVLAGDFSGFNGDINLMGGRLVLDQAGAFSFDNFITGPGSLVFNGGTVNLVLGNTHSGGTLVTNGVTLALGNASPLGSGVLTLDNGTIHATADVAAANRSLNIGTGGGRVAVDDGFILTTGGSAANTGTLEKSGAGIWRVQGGNAGTVGLLTVSGGTLDLNRNDTYGDNASSQQNLFIGSGGTVTNGTLNTGYNAFRSVTLSGGTLSVTNSLNALAEKFQAYGIKEGIVVTGSSPSIMNDLVNGVNGAINIGGTTDLGGFRGSNLRIDVADVTNSPEADLVISAKLKNSVGPGGAFVNLISGIEKTGSGTLELSGMNTYTGNTHVVEGRISIQEPYLAVTADVLVNEGAVIQLDFDGTNAIDQLVLAGVYQEPGVYGAQGSGAPFESARIAGSGTLTVRAGPDLTPFEQWMVANHPSIVAPDNGPDSDPDGDGASNLFEFAYGGNPADGADRGLRRVAVSGIEGMDYLTLTVLVRTPLVFAGAGPLTGSRDGISYTIRGSSDLSAFAAGVVEIPALDAGLPAAPDGYAYHSFRLSTPVSEVDRGFLQGLAAPLDP